jgi:hypothetical protein
VAVVQWPWVDLGVAAVRRPWADRAAVAVGLHPVRVAAVAVAVAELRRARAAAVRRGQAVVAAGQPRAEPVAGVRLHAGLAVAAGHLPPAAVVQVVGEHPAARPPADRVRRRAHRVPAWRRPRRTPRARP